jgi:hypothetical protein
MKVEILGWNPVNDRTSVLKASVYIKPTLKLLDLFNKAPFYRTIVKVSDTNSCYDDRNMFAIIDKSSDVPNKRDNFFDSTGLYVITLDTIWRGYPSNNGSLEIQEGVIDDIVNYLIKPCDKGYQPSPSTPTPSIDSSSATPEPSNPSLEPSNPSLEPSNPSPTPELDMIASMPTPEAIVENFENNKVLGLNKETLVLIGASLILIFAISFFMRKK